MVRKVNVEELAAPSIRWMRDSLKGEDIFIVGMGPSMLNFDCQRLEGKNVMALNRMIFTLRKVATIHHFADEKIHEKFIGFAYDPKTTVVCQNEAAIGLLTSNSTLNANDNVRVFVSAEKQKIGLMGVTREDYHLWFTRTTATSAIMLAWKLGAKRIYLLGVDACALPTEKTKLTEHQALKPEIMDLIYYADGGKKEDLKESIMKVKDGKVVLLEPHGAWNENMRELELYMRLHATGVSVINLSPISTIEAWPKQSMDEVI